MKKLSTVLLLIGFAFMTAGANTLLRGRILHFERKWNHAQKAPVLIPIEAILDKNSIEVRFLENVDYQVTFQVKDQQGNIIFQDIVIPNEKEIYKIDLDGLKFGHYELLYIEEDMTLIGEFEIEHSILL